MFNCIGVVYCLTFVVWFDLVRLLSCYDDASLVWGMLFNSVAIRFIIIGIVY